MPFSPTCPTLLLMVPMSALVATQVSVTLCPATIDVGLALKVAVGTGPELLELLALPPQLASTRVKARSNAEDFALPWKQLPTKLLNVVKFPIPSSIIVRCFVIRFIPRPLGGSGVPCPYAPSPKMVPESVFPEYRLETLAQRGRERASGPRAPNSPQRGTHFNAFTAGSSHENKTLFSEGNCETKRLIRGKANRLPIRSQNCIPSSPGLV